MPIYRLLTAAAALALVAGAADAQTGAKAAAKTEAQARAATGKASTDAPANTAVQGTAKAVREGAAPAAATAPAATVAQAGASAAPAGFKPVTVQGDLIDTLRLSGEFNTFLKGVDSTNLTSLLKTNKNLTVFAPTDAAFAAMPPGELARLQGDKAAMQKFILHHVVNAPIDSGKIKGHAGPVPSGAQDNIMLDGSDEAGTLKVDGATIVQADVRTGSGLLQVVDKVLQPGTAAPATASAGASGTAAPASATAASPK